MKAAKVSVLFASLAAAHSAVRTITIDGNLYPARDVRLDRNIGVRRIEWNFDDVNSFPAMAIVDVTSPAITCGLNASPGELKAVARAGSNVTVQWTGIVANHQGPVMSYLGAYTPGQKPQDIKFFKIAELGFDKSTQRWGNEELIRHDFSDTFQLPSDIKPGLYVLRTELLALHGNQAIASPNPFFGGPQFYTHCYNIKIEGSGSATPEGVTFPGGYKRNDPGVVFNLYTSRAAWDNYIIPGPPKYNGKYEAPTGPAPVVAPVDRGVFPAEFEAKYQAAKKKADQWMYGTINAVNTADPNGRNITGLGQELTKYIWANLGLIAETYSDINALKAEATRLGLTKAGNQ